jgi:hypothetical protein
VWVRDGLSSAQGVVSEHVVVLLDEESADFLVGVDGDEGRSAVAVDFVVVVSVFEAFEEFCVV